ncbi:uncharacterized protein LOC132795288 [Drosophila nasuta]|uniref:uncharacterized protein LOC132795288 n=1 Tax=Drosophila nasuta TaxID=42062 RepID=UPI00295F4DB6|nr:uncharacterized protein LOC132795288 [Drosophila nasuta]
MALFPSSSRPRTLMEQLLARKIEAAASAAGGGSSTSGVATATSGASALGTLVAASTTVAAGGAASIVSRLRRTDSLDSTSSLGSLAFGEDVCRCDDCLLGIVDLYVISAAEAAKKRR